MGRLDPVGEDRVTPDRVAPDRVAPDRVAPDRVAPDRVTPDRVTLGGQRPVVLCIGGWDPSAHAGLAVDLSVCGDLGCHGVGIQTALTAQNSVHVAKVEAMSAALLEAQWSALIEDITPAAIKIGLLTDVESVACVADWLDFLHQSHPDIPVVLDPVGLSTTGGHLQQPGTLVAIRQKLLPKVTIVTPNLLELAQLMDEIDLFESSNEAMPLASDIEPWMGGIRRWFNSHPESLDAQWLIKGGHGDGTESRDYWITSTSWTAFASPRRATDNTRGSGCTLATALASFLAQGYDMADAITLAKAYLNQSITASYRIGKGGGPLGHMGWPDKLTDFPDIYPQPFAVKPVSFPKLESGSLGLYPVVDSVAWVERLLARGIRTIQLRIKRDVSDEIRAEIQQAVALGRRFGAQVFINDHWEEAIRCGAFGIHLGQEDLATADLQAIAKAGICLGVSTHGYFEIARARAIQPSYIALGHVFPTQTKSMPSQPQGLVRLQHYAALLQGFYPTVAIGGIDKRRMPDVLRCGVSSVALVSAITKADDPDQATDELLALFQHHQYGGEEWKYA